jgi:predicted DNA-binding protein (MmcQ/YjbR family)
MTDWLAYALDKPGARRDEPWENDVVAKVGDKIFAFLGGSGSGGVTSIGVKCGNREIADEWLLRYPEDATKMAYIGQHGWNNLAVGSGIPDDELRDAIDTSYELIVAKLPKRIRDGLGTVDR